MSKVSMVMAVYNGERHLAESIESILGQTFSDFEFVIVDDASIDSTPKILKTYSEKDSRIRVITNTQNLGLTISLNVGVRAANGQYIARMDAGDVSHPERLGKQVAFLDMHPDHVLVGSWTDTFNDDSVKVGEMNGPIDHAAIRSALIRYNPIVHSSIMMRADVLKKAGGYDEEWRYAQDYELYFRLMKLGKLANLSEHLASYRLSPNSITRKKNNKQVGFAIRARLKAIHDGQYGILAYFSLIRPLIGLILPYKAKEFIKKV